MEADASHSHVRDMDETSRRHHEAVLLRLGVRHWAEFDRTLVAAAHEAHLGLQMRPQQYHLDGVEINCPSGVYHPTIAGSSTFMLRHLHALAGRAVPSILEVGVGSGAVLLSLARRHGPGRYLGVDIAERAVAAAQANAQTNGIDIEVRQSDLFAAVGGERFDVILFNPPLYDREPRNEVESHMLCDPGGRLLERFLAEVPRHLNAGGAAYVVAANIGQVAPLNNPALRIALQGVELFDTGVMRALVKVVPNPRLT